MHLPVAALIQADIYDEFVAHCLERIAAIQRAIRSTLIPSSARQVSAQQMQKIASYVDVGRDEGAEVLIGGQRAAWTGRNSPAAITFQPTVLKGDNKMRVFRRRSSAPCWRSPRSPTTRTPWRSPMTPSTRARRRRLDPRRHPGIQDRPRHQGRPRLDELLPPVPGRCLVRRLQIAGIGRENHLMMLDHYSQTKNLLVSYSTKPLGLF